MPNEILSSGVRSPAGFALPGSITQRASGPSEDRVDGAFWEPAGNHRVCLALSARLCTKTEQAPSVDVLSYGCSCSWAVSWTGTCWGSVQDWPRRRIPAMPEAVQSLFRRSVMLNPDRQQIKNRYDYLPRRTAQQTFPGTLPCRLAIGMLTCPASSAGP